MSVYRIFPYLWILNPWVIHQKRCQDILIQYIPKLLGLNSVSNDNIVDLKWNINQNHVGFRGMDLGSPFYFIFPAF